MKSLINSALFKEQLKRFWSIAALSLLTYVLLVISPLYSYYGGTNEIRMADSIISIFTMRNPFVIMASVIMPFVAVIAMFSYLFQPKSTAAMHSFPFTKKQLYFTNMAAGITLIIVPLIVLCAFLLNPVTLQLPEVRFDSEGAQYFGYISRLPVELYPGGLQDGAVVNTFPIVAGFFFRALLTFVYYYAVFLLAATVAGNAVVYTLLCGVIPFIPCAFLMLGSLTGSFFLLGYESYRLGDILSQLMVYTNPVSLGAAFNFYSPVEPITVAHSNLLLRYAVYVLIALALLAVSFWCSHIRKQERAGDSVVFTALKNVLIFLFSMAGMIMLGTFFLSVFGNVMLLYAGFAIGFFVSYFIAQMIAEKTFNVLYKAREILKFGGVMVGLFVTVIIAARIDLFGYQTYSPNESEVYGVYLYPRYTINVNMPDELSEEYRLTYFVTDEKIIADTLWAHKQIIEERHSLRGAFIKSLERFRDYEIIEQPLMIQLKNGELVSRKYALPRDFMREIGLTGVLLEEEVILSRYAQFKKTDEIEKLGIQYEIRSEDGSYDKYYAPEPIYIEDPGEILSVIEEIKKDIIITERERQSLEETATESELKNLEETGGDFYNNSIYIFTESKKTAGGMRYAGVSVSLYRYENVDRWLKSKGLR